MFHWQNETYFGRRKDGSVRVLKFSQPFRLLVIRAEGGWPDADEEYPEAEIDLTIPAEHWGSIVASVSYAGEEGGRWFQAMAFHDLTSRLLTKQAELEKELAECDQAYEELDVDPDYLQEQVVKVGQLEGKAEELKAMIEFLKSCTGNDQQRP
jgi:hypothetical protein